MQRNTSVGIPDALGEIPIRYLPRSVRFIFGIFKYRIIDSYVI